MEWLTKVPVYVWLSIFALWYVGTLVRNFAKLMAEQISLLKSIQAELEFQRPAQEDRRHQ